MFGIGFPELFIILLVALLAFGPEKLPEIARMLGKVSGELKKGSDSLRKEFYNSVYTPADDWKNRINQESRNLLSTASSDTASSNTAASATEKRFDAPKPSMDADHTPDGRLISKVESPTSAEPSSTIQKTESETDRG